MSKNPFEIVTQFEEEMAAYTGAPFAVAVDSCTSALFLSLRYQRHVMQQPIGQEPRGGFGTALPAVEIPRKTFISVPLQAIEAGFPIKFEDYDWHEAGWYWLRPYGIIDSALFLHRRMWEEFAFFRQKGTRRGIEPRYGDYTYACLSFQYRKHLPIGRGGMILHDDPGADEWFRKARNYGRLDTVIEDDPGPTFVGWRKYMTPDEAARGLCFLHRFPDHPGSLEIDYPDISNKPVFARYKEGHGAP